MSRSRLRIFIVMFHKPFRIYPHDAVIMLFNSNHSYTCHISSTCLFHSLIFEITPHHMLVSAVQLWFQRAEHHWMLQAFHFLRREWWKKGHLVYLIHSGTFWHSRSPQLSTRLYLLGQLSTSPLLKCMKKTGKRRNSTRINRWIISCHTTGYDIIMYVLYHVITINTIHFTCYWSNVWYFRNVDIVCKVWLEHGLHQ